MASPSGIKELKVSLFDWFLTIGVFFVGVFLLGSIVEFANRTFQFFR